MSTPHPYADILLAIYYGKQMQIYKWHGWVNATTSETLNYMAQAQAPSSNELRIRIVPETITINGIEVPKPESVAPDDGSYYYIPNLDDSNVTHIKSVWYDDASSRVRLARGIVHLTRESAEQHAKAIISASGGTL